MNTLLKTGTIIVSIALLFYSIGFFTEHRKRSVNSSVLLCFTLGIICDITATIYMILGSSKGMVTLHGCIGYSALIVMLIDTILLWKHNLAHGAETTINTGLHLYSRIAYIWWIIAFITGGLIAGMNHTG